MQPAPTSNVLLYQSADGEIRLDVQLQQETVWLTQAQMADLFARDQGVISRHIKNVFSTDELDELGSVQKMHIASPDNSSGTSMHKMHRSPFGRPTSYYNLDVIISVGYRVNSVKGTQFRRWATQVLRDYLVQGYVLNERLLSESQRQLADLKRLVQLQSEVVTDQKLTTDQSTALLRILSDYARALDVLDQYDHQRLRVAKESVSTGAENFELTYEYALATVDALREQFGGLSLFGREKTSLSKAPCAPFTKALAVWRCTRAWRKKRPTCFTSSKKPFVFRWQ
jgi:hypothetical protein